MIEQRTTRITKFRVVPWEDILWPSDGLVSWWKLNGNANDAWGSNHGIAYGVVWLPKGAGSFDGMDDYVDCGKAINPNLIGDLTVEVWLKPIAFGKSRGIAETFFNREFALIISDLDGRVKWLHGDGVFYEEFTTTDPILTLDIWQHLVAVRDMTAAKFHFYLNGQLVESFDVTITPVVSTYTLKIGEYAYSDRWFKGLIDEVRIYNRALSADEIKKRCLKTRIVPLEVGV